MATLPANLQNSLDKAVASDDGFVIKAVAAQAKAQNPTYEAEINRYMIAKLTPKLEAKQTAPKPKAEPEDLATGFVNFWTDGWSGNLEGGALLQNGNSKNENLNAAVKVSKETQNWQHIAKLSGSNNSSDGVRSAEEYRTNLQTRNKLSAKDYIFGELDWVKDRYSGYDFRLSELLGYGYKFYDDDEFKLSAEAALGTQQSQRTNADIENSIIQKLSGDLEWAINEQLSFLQHLSTEHSNDAFFSNSQSALKTKITDSLALKAAYDIEHISQVPAGTKKLDTKTTLNVLYDF